ncbi:MAG: ABC transporter ATP-binding protein [Clostridia bacterium]|nr:ABC transporter ATP-binding protein [Clostridia bacterium]
MNLEVNGLCFSYDEKRILEDISLRVKPGSFVGLIGPNGSGKSTILKHIYRALRPEAGEILLDGEALESMPYRKSAEKMGVVGQENEVPFDFQVKEIVAMGRNPHKRLFQADTDDDRRIVREALERIGMAELADRNYQHLSGGEKQRVLIARMLAQQTEFLILDEPTNHLDVRYQLQIFDLVRSLPVTVLSAVHDMNMAAAYCDYLYAIKDGRIALAGAPEDVLTAEHIRDVFGVEADVGIHPRTGRLNIVFLPQSLQWKSI